ncbi:MAG: hypothetical protein VKL39_13670 [Leptolyngbyaceae bacterium]|nr:hypothetical protein [Leptolyngbyaceae bacterium]
MNAPLEANQAQLAVIEANADRIGAIAHQGYQTLGEKGTVVILRQLDNPSPNLEDWQLQFRPMSQIEMMLSDWKQSGLQDMLIRYNPDVSVICTFLYPNGAHTSYHFSPEPFPPA